MRKVFRNNGLSIVFALLFILSLWGQALTGFKEHNQQLQELGAAQISFSKYFSSGHFLQATFENWESEFLQMALFVVLTIFLYQKGSSESKDPEEEDPVDKEPNPRKKGAPWAVRQGGLVLAVYKHSLSIALVVIFVLSFVLHWYGSMKDYNEEEMLRGGATETAWEYLGNPRLWFESFQNWQSEFLSVFAIVIFSIFLRQKGSAQSKPVDEKNSTTG